MRYLYKPYHPWRHGFRKERLRKCFFVILRMLLLLEIGILAARYIEIYEVKRMVTETYVEEPVMGIGVNPESGDLFWFHRDTEMEKE